MRVNDLLREETLGEGLLLYDPESDRVFTLNRTAGFIYSGIKRGEDETSLARGIKSQFQIDEDGRAQTDVKEAIQQMASDGILLGTAPRKQVKPE